VTIIGWTEKERQAMIAIRKRGSSYHFDFLNGRKHVVRGSLGTKDHSAALRLVHRIEIAMSEGPRSTVWGDLRPVVPPLTFARLANYIGVEGKFVITWKEFREIFEAFKTLQVRLDKLADNTLQNYKYTLNAFEAFLDGDNITMLQNIDSSAIDRFQLWRLAHVNTRKGDGSSVVDLDMHHLHHAFAIAVNKGFLQTNPVEAKSKKRNPSNGAQPYSADELKRLRDNANDNLFIFLFLRWTGFRRSDATILTWAEIHFDRKEIEHVCKKTKRSTGKNVIIPIAQELMAALEGEFDQRKPNPNDLVLIDSATGQPFNRPDLACNDRYNALTYRIQVLGEHAGVTDAGPHRFRDTFAVDMLLRTDNLDYVADLLGDTVKTVKEYYLPFVRELRERVRFHLDNGKGIEQFETPASQTNKSAA
jgi:integrase